MSRPRLPAGQGIAVPVRPALAPPLMVAVTSSDAVLVPTEEGLNRTATPHVPPAGRLAHVLDAITKLEALTPDSTTEIPLTDTVLVFTTVNVKDVDAVPVGTEPKSREIGPTLSVIIVHPPGP